MRIDFTVIGFLEFLCYLMVAGFLIRFATAKYHDSPWAKGLAFIY